MHNTEVSPFINPFKVSVFAEMTQKLERTFSVEFNDPTTTKKHTTIPRNLYTYTVNLVILLSLKQVTYPLPQELTCAPKKRDHFKRKGLFFNPIMDFRGRCLLLVFTSDPNDHFGEASWFSSKAPVVVTLPRYFWTLPTLTPRPLDQRRRVSWPLGEKIRGWWVFSSQQKWDRKMNEMRWCWMGLIRMFKMAKVLATPSTAFLLTSAWFCLPK